MECVQSFAEVSLETLFPLVRLCPALFCLGPSALFVLQGGGFSVSLGAGWSH